MSTENFEPTGYQDDSHNGASSVLGKSSHEQPVVKKKSNLPLIIFGVVFLTLAGGVGFMMFGGKSKPAPKPKPAVSAPKEDKQPEAPAQPAADAPAAADPFATTPAAVDPSAPPAAQPGAVDPLTGLPIAAPVAAAVDPLTGLPVQPAAPQQPVVAIDPLTGQPVAQPQAALPADPLAQPAAPQPSTPAVDPLTGLPVAPTAVQPAAQPAPVVPVVDPAAPVVTAPVAPVAADVAPTSALPVGAADPLSQFRDMLAPLDGRVTTLEGKVSKHEQQLSRIERSLANRPAVARKAAPAPRPQNTVRVEPRVAPPVSRVIIEEARPSVSEAAPVSSASVGSCNVQAIVHGRVWVKSSDGSFSSYGEGDNWSNGQRIDAIDPHKGVKVDGRWICM